MNRTKHLLGLLAAGSLLVSGTAIAGPISFTMSPVGTSSNMSAPRAAERAFLATLVSGVVTEDFEDIAVGTQGSPISTDVGSFSMEVAGSGGLCRTSCGDGVIVLDAGSSIFGGRFNTTVGGSNWLDSFDAQEFRFTPNAGINSIGFYITDPNDSGGRFTFNTTTGTETVDFGSIFGGGLSNGRAFYLTFTSADDITGLTIFSNNGDDGFGVDDVTIGVPEPGTLALLGMGLLGAGLARRRRAA